MKKSLLASLILHILVLMLLALTSGGSGNGNGGQSDGSNGTGTGSTPPVQNIAPPPSIEVVEIEPDVLDKLLDESRPAEKPKKPTKVVKQKCPDYFGGIGITYEQLISDPGKIIKEVHSGYPAAKAGVLVGDIIIGQSEEVRGPIGKPVTVYILRGSETWRFNLVRAKVCIEDIGK